MGTTPKMGIPYPESTDPVANGAQNMEDLATTVDDKTGLVRIAGGAHSGPLLSINNVFSSDFSNYLLKTYNFFTPAGVRTLCFQLQNASPSTTSYYWAGYYSTFTGGFGPANSTSAGTSYFVQGTAGGYSPTANDIQIFNPAAALKTNIVVSGINFDAGYHMGGYHDVATAYNGFRIFNVSNDNCNFGWTLYGYRD